MTVTPCISIVNKDEVWNKYWDTVSVRYSTLTTPCAFDVMEKEIQIKWEETIPLNFYITQMERATLNNNIQLIQHIYHKKKMLIDSGTETGMTFLYQAAKNQCLEAAETLIELGANPNVSITAESTYGDVRGTTPLWKSMTMHIDEESQHYGYFLSSTFDFTRCKDMIKLFLKYGAVAMPEGKGQHLLKDTCVLLDQEKTALTSTLQHAISWMPHVLMSMIVNYV